MSGDTTESVTGDRVTHAAIDTVADALEQWLRSPRSGRAPGGSAADSVAAAVDAAPSKRSVWLALAVFQLGLPNELEVRHAHRRIARQGASEVLAPLMIRASRMLGRGWRIELLRSSVVVDVTHTAGTDLATGIQRVARETVRRWETAKNPIFVTWTRNGRSMRRLLPAERETALHGAPPKHRSARVADRNIVIPVDGDYILPELAAESWRTQRVAAFAEFSHTRTNVIGFDCVPLTTAETVGDGMPGAFARNLGAVARMHRVGAISEAAADEYRGWRRMLPASGLVGPEIESVLLAAEPGEFSKDDEEEFAAMVELTDTPLVLVVGSHEPRKNHLAVLQAAELAWRAGLQFHLVFVGGNSWNSLDFSDALELLQEQGRTVTAVSALPDSLLWAAYTLARFSIFVSLNEGFGLPVAESLAVGTPVMTSNYGSMEQIALNGGAVVVDPRNDESVLGGFRQMLDDSVYARLRAEAARYTVRTWDTYSEELWRYFITDVGNSEVKARD
jgi:glycosyltransferase involved in cell wall biosynthesis